VLDAVPSARPSSARLSSTDWSEEHEEAAGRPDLQRGRELRDTTPAMWCPSPQFRSCPWSTSRAAPLRPACVPHTTRFRARGSARPDLTWRGRFRTVDLPSIEHADAVDFNSPTDFRDPVT
jgi:hypothetical protein